MGKGSNSRAQHLRRELAATKRKLAEATGSPEGPKPVLFEKPPSQQSLVMVQQSMSMTHVGPTPAPWVLEHYEKLDPGRSAKLFDLAESQAHHRMDLEKKVITSDIRRSWGGLGSAFVLSLCGFGVAVYALFLGQPWVAGTVATGVIGGDLTAFLYGKSSQTNERKERAENLGGKKAKK